MYVRLAIVSTFEYNTQLAFFKSRARMLLQHFPREKITTIEGAINLTNDKNIELDMMQLGQVIKAARDLGKMPTNTRLVYRALSLDQWAKQSEKDTTVSVIEDKQDITTAFLSIADRHPELKGKQELVEGEAKSLVNIFREAEIPINHLQQATAALAHHNAEHQSAQIWVVPAGQGKSTIHAALTYLFLKNTDHDIHVVFNDDGLKKKDADLNENFIRLCEKAGLDYKKRVKYQTNLARKPKTT